MKMRLILIGIIIVEVLVLLRLSTTTEAVQIQCKHENAECSVNDSNHPCCSGLSCVPFNTHSGNGKCQTVPTLTPTPTTKPTATPTPTPTPTQKPRECDEDCVTPTVTPTPTSAPVVSEASTAGSENNVPSGPSSSTDTPSCGNPQPPMVQDLWYSDYKVTGDTAQLTLHWGRNDQYNKVNIAYGEQINTWNYGALNVEDTGSFVIGSLKPHQRYWFQVAYLNGCAIGLYSHPVDP